MSENDYHQCFDAVTRSAVKVYMDSPYDYYLTYVARSMTRPEPSRAMEAGTLVHRILLERVEFDDAVAIYPESCLKSDGSLNPKPAAQFREDNSGKVCLKDDKAIEIYRAVNAARLSVLGPILGGNHSFEDSYITTKHEIALKCKPDICAELEDRIVIYDLKCVDDISAGLFHRNAKRLKYWLQDAHYSAVLSESGKPVEFRFFALELRYPFRVRAYEYDQHSRQLAAQKHDEIVRQLAASYVDDHWPDTYDGTLILSPWDIGDATETFDEGD